MPHYVALGPQGEEPTIHTVLDTLGVQGPLALINAGWQEREGDFQEVSQICRREVVNLHLYDRWDRVAHEDPELAKSHRKRQDMLRRLQEIYRLRLTPLMDTARLLWAYDGPERILRAERKSAIQAVRSLDDHHMEHVRTIHQEFEQEANPQDRSSIRRQREEIAEALAPCKTVLIAGGQVTILVNRLRLFSLKALFGERDIVAWSGGCMALSDRLILFHDHPPQGAGDAEVLDEGLGIFPNTVMLPHARTRLDLEKRDRVARFARRFAPAVCITLNGGSQIQFDGTTWQSGKDISQLTSQGSLREVTTW